MIFCNDDWTSFKLTFENPTQILILSIMYQGAFDITWPNMTLQVGMLAKRYNKISQMST
jgi:hypothetical protein